MNKRPTTKIIENKVIFPLRLSIEFHKKLGIAAAKAEQTKHKYVMHSIIERMRKDNNEKTN